MCVTREKQIRGEENRRRLQREKGEELARSLLKNLDLFLEGSSKSSEMERSDFFSFFEIFSLIHNSRRM